MGNGFCLRPVGTSSELLVLDNVQYMKCCDSGLELPEINYEIQRKVQSLRSPNAKLKSWTNKWMVRRIQDQDTMVAIRDLKTYARKDREIERGTNDQGYKFLVGTRCVVVHPKSETNRDK